MLARCRGAFFLLLLPAFATSAGCRNKTDGLEAELRSREMLYRQTLEDQRGAESRIMAMQSEIDALRQGAKVTPEQAAQTYGLKRIVLGRSTGGWDQDNLPGDEVLQVVVEPRDESDHTIKAPGMLQIFALEVSPQGIKTQLSQWDIPPEQLRQSWKQGLLSTGYTLTLPWKSPPITEQVRVVVRLITPDQRVYEADKDVKVRVMPGAAGKRPAPMPVPDGVPVPCPWPAPDGGPVLLPAGQAAPTPHISGWRPVQTNSGITIGPPTPLERP